MSEDQVQGLNIWQYHPKMIIFVESMAEELQTNVLWSQKQVYARDQQLSLRSDKKRGYQE